MGLLALLRQLFCGDCPPEANPNAEMAAATQAEQDIKAFLKIQVVPKSKTNYSLRKKSPEFFSEKVSCWRFSSVSTFNADWM